MANVINVTRIRFDRFNVVSGTRELVGITQNVMRLLAAQAPIGSIIQSTDMFGSPVTILISSVVENSVKSGDLSKTLFNAEVLRCTPQFAEHMLRVREVVATEHESETQFNSAKSQGHIPARQQTTATPPAAPEAVVSQLQAQAENFL